MTADLDYSQLPFDDFLNRVSARTPVPGGGSVSAAVGALASALARMVVAYTKLPNDGAELSLLQRLPLSLQRMDELFRALITKDAHAYAELCAAQKAMKSVESTELNQAQQNAAAVAMETAALASNALASLDEVKTVLNPRLASDLGIVALLLDAVANAAGYTVLVNAQDFGDESLQYKIKTEIREILEHARDRTKSIRKTVDSLLQMNNDPGR